MSAKRAVTIAGLVLWAAVVGEPPSPTSAQERPPPMTEETRLPRLVFARQPLTKIFLLNEQGQPSRELTIPITTITPRETVGNRYRFVFGTNLSEAAMADFVPVDEAAEYFSALIAANPKHGFGYGQRAIVWIDKNQLPKTLADLDVCVSLLPNHFQYRLIRSEQRIRGGQLQPALEDVNRCLEQEPKHLLALRLRGICHCDLGHPEQALADYNECIKAEPNNAVLYRLRAIVYRNTGRRNEAIADLTTAMQHDPTDPIAPHQRAFNHFEARDYAKALADVNESLRRNSQHRPALLLRADIARAQGRFAEALADRRAVLKFAPNDADALYLVAWLLATCSAAELRNGAEAVKLAEKACELSGYRAPVLLDTLAAAYAETGDFARAVSTQQKAIELLPKDKQDIYLQRLQLYKDGKPFRE